MQSKAIHCIVPMIMAVALTMSALGQDDPRRNNDPIMIPKGETELQYRRPEDLPRQLRAALHRSRCSYQPAADLPLRIVKPDPNRESLVALVPCWGIVMQGAAFTIGRYWEPSPVSFAVMGYPDGFAASRHPGYLEWHADKGILTATQGTDLKSCRGRDALRYTYRSIDSIESPFVLTKIERHLDECNTISAEPWSTFWETPNWVESK
jgi:hypothetical protein